MTDEQLRAAELVSAYLDGEATPAEIAEIERDDALLDRVEQLRPVRDAVAAPVAPLPEELRDRMIGAALAVAGTETAQRPAARIIPIHRRRETRFAVAAAAIGLAAVVSAGLFASRGNDDPPEMASEASVATAEFEEMAADAATADDSASFETAAEPMPEEAPAAEEEMSDATAAVDEMAAAAAESTESADGAPAGAAVASLESVTGDEQMSMEQPAEELAEETSAMGDTDTARQAKNDEPRDGGDTSEPVVDLGSFENLQSLFDSRAARLNSIQQDEVVTDSGTCFAAVRDRALKLEAETGQAFIAVVGTAELLFLDGRLAYRADGTVILIYAAAPNCETGIYELGAPDDS